MTIVTSAVVAAWITLTPPSDALTVTARLDAGTMKRGGQYEILLETTFGPGLSDSEAGIPAPILQLEVPSCVRLGGKQLRTYRQLAQNEFLQEPYERLIDDAKMKIEFRLANDPKPDDRIFLNIIAYVHGDKGDFFVRRRLALPLEPAATAMTLPGESSSWGTENDLDIGDEAPDFSLPSGDGSMVSLASYRGKQHVIVTTYRAHW